MPTRFMTDPHEMRSMAGRFDVHAQRAAVWRKFSSDMRFQKALHRVRCEKHLLPEWLADVLQAHALSGFLSEYFTGTGIAHLTGESLARVPILIPPTDEQAEIVHRVDRLLLLAGRT
jgi:type I restriction enzyme, S subunit